MKTRALLSAVVISGILVVPHAAFSRDDDYNRGSGWLTDGTIMTSVTYRDAGI